MAEAPERPAVVVRTAEHEALFLGALLSGALEVVEDSGVCYATLPAPGEYYAKHAVRWLYCRNEVEVALLLRGQVDEWRELACVFGEDAQALRRALQGPFWHAHVER